MFAQMATPGTAMALLEQLRTASFATAQKELDSLRQFAAAEVSSTTAGLLTPLWKSSPLLRLKTGSSRGAHCRVSHRPS